MNPASRERLHRAAHLLGLGALALAQPLLALLAGGADFFVAWGLELPGAIAVALALLLLPALVLCLIVELAYFVGPRSGRAVLGFAVAFLVTLIAATAFGRTGLSPAASIALSAGIGALFALFYTRVAAVRSVLDLLAVAPVLVLVVFLWAPGVRALRATDVDAAVEVPPPPPDHPGIVLVVFDELPLSSLLDPALRIDAGRLPNFARLAATATWYRQASTVAEQTTQAIPALLTGRIPDTRRPASLAAHPVNLFTVLGVPGRANIVETVTDLCPAPLRPASLRPRWRTSDVGRLAADLTTVYAHVVSPADWRERLPSLQGDWRNFGGPAGDPGRHDPAGEFRLFIDQLPDPATGTLSFVHVNLPHVPFQYLPSGRRYGRPGEHLHPHGASNRHWGSDAWETEQALQRHLLQVGFVDRLVGELLDRLEAHGTHDEVLLVVTADHGAGFRPGGLRRSVDPSQPADVLAVPLFVKLPGQRSGRIDEANVQTIDLFPTLLDAAGRAVPPGLDGRSLLGDQPPPAFKTVMQLSGSNQKLDRVTYPAQLDLRPGAERISALFPSGDLLALGPHRDLVGLPLPDDLEDSTPLTWRLQEGWRYAAVDPGATFLPTHVVGNLQADASSLPTRQFAVAVNGRIRATTRAFETQAGGWGLTAVLPESSWSPGGNQVDLLAIVQHGDNRQLLRVPETGGAKEDRVALRTPWFGADRLHLPDGRRIPIQNGTGLRGAITQKPREIELDGWAGDLAAARPADLVLVFDRGEQILRLDPRRPPRRPAAGRPAIPGGAFRIPVPAALESRLDDRRVRFFALLDDRAAELPFLRPSELPEHSHYFEDRFGDGWLKARQGLLPVAPGSGHGGILARMRTADELTVTGWVVPDGGATPAVAVIRADGSVAGRKLAYAPPNLHGPRRHRFRIRMPLDDRLFPIQVLGITPPVAWRLEATPPESTRGVSRPGGRRAASRRAATPSGPSPPPQAPQPR